MFPYLATLPWSLPTAFLHSWYTEWTWVNLPRVSAENGLAPPLLNRLAPWVRQTLDLYCSCCYHSCLLGEFLSRQTVSTPNIISSRRDIYPPLCGLRTLRTPLEQHSLSYHRCMSLVNCFSRCKTPRNPNTQFGYLSVFFLGTLVWHNSSHLCLWAIQEDTFLYFTVFLLALPVLLLCELTLYMLV